MRIKKSFSLVLMAAMLFLAGVSTASADGFYTGNLNLGHVSAETNTNAYFKVKNNTIETVAAGAVTDLNDRSYAPDHALTVTVNTGSVSAKTNTRAPRVIRNDISTSAFGASTSIQNRGFGRYATGSANFGRVAAQTNTMGSVIKGNSISTVAVGSSIGIINR